MKMTKSDKEYLLSIGVPEEDWKQMEEASKKTKFYLSSDKALITDNIKLSQKEVIGKIGRQGFWSGISRSAFHWSAIRECLDGKNIIFDSSAFFKEDLYDRNIC